MGTRVGERDGRVSRADDRVVDVRLPGGSGRRDQSLERRMTGRGYSAEAVNECDAPEGGTSIWFFGFHIFSSPVYAGRVLVLFFFHFFVAGVDGRGRGARRSCHRRCRRNVRGLFNLQQLSHARARDRKHLTVVFLRPFPPIMEYLCFKDLSDPDQPISIESDPVFGN